MHMRNMKQQVVVETLSKKIGAMFSEDGKFAFFDYCSLSKQSKN